MTTITICTTCRNETSREAPEGDPTGEAFLTATRAAAADTPVKVRGVACLMGCAHGCNAAISDNGKMTYVLGRFDGGAADAEALVDHAAKHAESDSGVVPFRQWHQGVKGHFVARVPPIDPQD